MPMHRPETGHVHLAGFAKVICLLGLVILLGIHVLFAAELAVSAPAPTAAGKQVVLTELERAYLAQKGSIRICVQPDWLPYERINEKGLHEGIGAEMMALMQERLGIRFVLHPTRELSLIHI